LTSSYQIGPNGQGSPGAGTGTDGPARGQAASPRGRRWPNAAGGPAGRGSGADGPAAGLAVQAGKQQPSAQQSAAGRPTAHARRDEQAGPPSQGLNNGGGAKIAPRPSYFLEINRRTLALFTGVMYLAKWTPYNSFAWIYTILTLLLPKKRAHGAEGAPAGGQSRPGLHGNSGKTAARQRRARPCTQAPAAWPAVAHSTQATHARARQPEEGRSGGADRVAGQHARGPRHVWSSGAALRARARPRSARFEDSLAGRKRRSGVHSPVQRGVATGGCCGERWKNGFL